MSELYTASAIHDTYCRASGLDPRDNPAILTRVRYLAKRGLLSSGTVVDDRGTLAFPKVELFRAAIYTELAALAMDVRALAPIAEAAARRHPIGLRIPASMKNGGGLNSRGGLWDAVRGVAHSENWTLLIELKRAGTTTEGGLVAKFSCDNVAELPGASEKVDKIFGREKVRTRAIVDLNSLFRPIIEIVGVPE